MLKQMEDEFNQKENDRANIVETETENLAASVETAHFQGNEEEKVEEEKTK